MFLKINMHSSIACISRKKKTTKKLTLGYIKTDKKTILNYTFFSLLRHQSWENWTQKYKLIIDFSEQNETGIMKLPFFCHW